MGVFGLDSMYLEIPRPGREEREKEEYRVRPNETEKREQKNEAYRGIVNANKTRQKKCKREEREREGRVGSRKTTREKERKGEENKARRIGRPGTTPSAVLESKNVHKLVVLEV